jgi:hypothetical protein
MFSFKGCNHFYPFFIRVLAVTNMVSMRLHYELKTLNGQKIVVVYKPEGVTHSKKEYPNTPIYSIREIEALEGLESVEQRLLQEAKQIFGGAIFTEELFNKHYPKRKVRNYGKKQRV